MSQLILSTTAGIFQDNLRDLVRRFYEKHYKWRGYHNLRLYIPCSALTLIGEYQQYLIPGNKYEFIEGESKFMGLPMYYNLEESLIIGVLEAPMFNSIDRPTMKMTNIFSDQPAIIDLFQGPDRRNGRTFDYIIADEIR